MEQSVEEFLVEWIYSKLGAGEVKVAPTIPVPSGLAEKERNPHKTNGNVE